MEVHQVETFPVLDIDSSSNNKAATLSEEQGETIVRKQELQLLAKYDVFLSEISIFILSDIQTLGSSFDKSYQALFGDFLFNADFAEAISIKPEDIIKDSGLNKTTCIQFNAENPGENGSGKEH